MGLCLSKLSSELPHSDSLNGGHESRAVFSDQRNSTNTHTRPHALFSLYSRRGTRPLNQDSAVLCQGFGMTEATVCAVFDGHGPNGHVVSELVRNRLPLILLNQRVVVNESSAVKMENIEFKLVPPNFDMDPKIWNEVITSSFEVMDAELEIPHKFDFSCSGTTAVVAIAQGEDLIVANLGDSRAILGTITENNSGIESVQLTTEHKPSVTREAERIRSCNGRVLGLKKEPESKRVWLPNEYIPGLAMSRALGDFVLKGHGVISVPDVSYRRLTPSDQFIVLATDGVWDMLSNDEVAKVAWEAKNEEAAAKAVVKAARAAWKRRSRAPKIDDCTVVCLFFHKKRFNSVL
ncbi:probable protein phosphatase 2C 72 [Humulus lupulus]|uniref:probable protein phosphatase 2C 72 n=1 Tax=Humulus lupulus TaxID=3486 RepID=UPI002B409388|nr:probable protein phosphatase 2C 72 [Humulus lupulus]